MMWKDKSPWASSGRTLCVVVNDEWKYLAEGVH